MATTPLEKQARRIKQILHKEGVSKASLESSDRELAFWLNDVIASSEIRARIKDKLEIWIADGILTRRQAMAMTEEELETFYLRQGALDRYEASKR